jgi:hypothetical protein
MKTLNNPWFATLVPAAIGFGFGLLCILFAASYGWSLFLGLPVLVSFLSAFCTSYRRPVSFGRAYGLAVVSLLVLGGFILIFAIDGLICLLMSLPLTLGLALIGAALGRIAGRSCRGNIQSALPILLLILFPCLVAFDSSDKSAAPIRAVTTSVIISAPIEKVWNTVVAFPRINEPPEGIFRCGISCPMEARIEGSGVGAIRYCIFTTGNFVEPITRWEQPSLLAFDVVSNPPPMRELSLYGSIDAPHLHGYMVSKHGQFKLTPRDGKILLEGTTWYSHSLAPQWYWGPISDQIIHRIHERVLNHIRDVAEAN